jgi:hypothetical protein
MKTLNFIVPASWVFFALATISFAQEAKKDQELFDSSLHRTSGGMSYWYAKENGGLEKVTGIPYSQLMCRNCHAGSCDECHRTEKNQVAAYTTEAARKQETCLKCHGRESAMILTIDKQANQTDVHIAAGMECMSCHSSREMHGDGKEYLSMKQPGAMDTRCENCHGAVSDIPSHTVHKGRLDCKACHERHVVSCTNCHFETVLKEKKRVSIPVSGWVFLMNYEGKVTSANMQTFVVPGPKTFLMFAPQHSHSVMAKGRTCGQCHASDILKQVQEGSINLTWLDKGEIKQMKGVIPVAGGVKWGAVYQDFQSGKWIPLENAPAPELHYAGFGTPLSKDQIDRLAKPQKER